MRRVMSLLLCLTLAACANLPGENLSPVPPVEQVWLDQRFTPPSERIDAADVFALSEAMKHYVHVDIAPQLRAKGLQRGLVDALYQAGQLKLDYDAALTRNAAQAFDARAGNCLSLVIMTAAFAKELGLTISYESAFLEETWSRAGNLYLRSGHVNVTLGRRFMDFGHGDGSRFTVDFMPADEIRGLRTRSISEETVVAMFMNNRAAEALVRGRVDDAYWWARAAITQNPSFLSAYNTLGVIYLRHGDLAAAERVFAQVLQREPQNTRAMFNLAQALSAQGRDAEAKPWREQLARLEPQPPFHFFNQGVAAAQRGDLQTARELFLRELGRDEYNPEVHFWLSLVGYRLGDLRESEKHLRLAVENSKSRGAHDIYAAKLAWLRAHDHP